jgi:Ca2+:H+ antiporter
MHYWAHFVPPVALLVLAAGLLAPATVPLLLACIGALLAAEVVAQRVGEPYGTLVLALAITVIDVALVLSIVLAGGANAAAVARDTIYAAVMVICNAAVGICLLLGGLRHGEQSFRIEGTGTGLAALVALSTLVLVIPALTTSSPGVTYTDSQLVFVALSSITLWAAFVFIQTVRHRDCFRPAVAADSPRAVVGVAIAVIVLMPETWAAMRAVRANRLQTSMNLAIGSALASIGLTIPVVVGAAVMLDLPMTLGLVPKDIAMLALTFVVAAITLGSGRTNLMQGAVHLSIFAAFMFLTLVP